MSKEIEEIRRKLRDKFSPDNDTVFPVVVTEVNEEDFTCTVMRDDQVNYFDVRLRGLVSSKLQGFAFIPKLESVVLVCRIGHSNELFICQFTEIDKIVFTKSDLSINIDSDVLEIVKEKAILKVTSDGFTIKNNASGLKKTLEDLIAAIKTLTVPTGVGPSGTPINAAAFTRVEQDLKNYMEG